MEEHTPALSLEKLVAHREWVRRVARTLVRDESLAEDLEQEVWLETLQSPPRSGRSFGGWLAAAMRHNLIDLRRSEDRRRVREHAVARPEAVKSVADLVVEAELHREVVAAVLRLDEPYRGTLLLRYFENLTLKDVARRQGVPLESVRTRVRRAIELLRARLDASRGGNRNAWRLAILPLTRAPGDSRPPAAKAFPATPFPGWIPVGGVLMAKKASAAVGVLVALLLLAGGATWSWVGSVEDRPPVAMRPLAPAREPHADPRPSSATQEASAHTAEKPAPDQGQRSPTVQPPVGVMARVFDEARRPAEGARATLSLDGKQVAVATVDGEGNLLLPQVVTPVSGRYLINVLVRDSRNRVARGPPISGRAYGPLVARGELLMPKLLLGDLVLRTARGIDIRVLAGGRSVPGAYVYAESDQIGVNACTDEVPTDDEGRARIENLWDGTWVVYARAPSLGRGRAIARVTQDEVGPIEVSLTSREIEVEVVEAGSGKPIEGAWLEIMVDHSTKHWTGKFVDEHPPVVAPPTDSAGRTRIGGLGQDEALRIDVIPQGMEMAKEGVPSTLVPGGERAVRIEMPAQRIVRFPVARGRGVPPVEGTLVRVDGREVQVENGAIVVGDLPPTGPVRLVAWAPDGSQARLRAGEGASQGEDAVFLPSRTLTVTVQDEDGLPVTESCVLAFDLEGNQQSKMVTPDAEGRTRLEKLVAAEYVVVAGATWDFGGGEVARIDLTDGDRTIDIVLGREFTVLARISVLGVRRLPGDLKCQAIYPHPWRGLEGRETLAGKEDPVRGEVRYRVRPLKQGAPVRMRFETPRFAPGRDVAPPPPGEEAVVDIDLK